MICEQQVLKKPQKQKNYKQKENVNKETVLHSYTLAALPYSLDVPLTGHFFRYT